MEDNFIATADVDMDTENQNSSLVVDVGQDNLRSSHNVVTKTNVRCAPSEAEAGGYSFVISESDEDSLDKAQSTSFEEEDGGDPFTISKSNEGSADLSSPSLVTTAARRTQKHRVIGERYMGYKRRSSTATANLGQTFTYSTTTGQEEQSAQDIVKDNEDNTTPTGDVIMNIEQQNATLGAGEVEDNLTSTAMKAQNTSTGDVTMDDNLSSKLVQVVSTTDRKSVV